MRWPQDYGLGGQTTLHAFCSSNNGREMGDNSCDTASSSSGLEHAGLQGAHCSPQRLQGPLGSNRFFVFCKLCNCVRPGLLSVVCKYCGSGLFIVYDGPSCWEDISPSTTLRGKCQKKNCTSDTPRFYLRCSQRHEGEEDGMAASLCHIHSNSRRVECIICEDIQSPILIFPCLSRHAMCLECFCQYANTALRERQFIEHELHGYTLSCPVGCDNSFIEDSHHFLVMGPEKYERFKNFGAEEYVLKNGGILCPAPNCGMGIFPDDDERRIRCAECQFESCRDCKREFHFDSCQDHLLMGISNFSNLQVDRERAERASWEFQSVNLIGQIAKACPGCSTKTERNGGCMHMVCSRCGTEWCWLCVKPWDRQCQALHWFG